MTKVQIICSRPGMLRNGIPHPASAFYDADRWSGKEIAAFKADPAFTVREVDDTAENVLTNTDFQLAVKAEVDRQVAEYKLHLEAGFNTTVSNAVAEKLLITTTETETTITNLGSQLTVANNQITELQKQIDAAAAAGAKNDSKK